MAGRDMKAGWIGAVLTAAVLACASGAGAADAAKKACYPDAKRLCPAQVHALNRHAVELCLDRQIEQTTPVCHQMIVQVRAQRLTAGKKPPRQ